MIQSRNCTSGWVSHPNPKWWLDPLKSLMKEMDLLLVFLFLEVCCLTSCMGDHYDVTEMMWRQSWWGHNAKRKDKEDQDKHLQSQSISSDSIGLTRKKGRLSDRTRCQFTLKRTLPTHTCLLQTNLWRKVSHEERKVPFLPLLPPLEATSCPLDLTDGGLTFSREWW